MSSAMAQVVGDSHRCCQSLLVTTFHVRCRSFRTTSSLRGGRDVSVPQVFRTTAPLPCHVARTNPCCFAPRGVVHAFAIMYRQHELTELTIVQDRPCQSKQIGLDFEKDETWSQRVRRELQTNGGAVFGGRMACTTTYDHRRDSASSTRT